MKDKHKDERKFCPKCNAPLGENEDGKPLCWCDVLPIERWGLEYEYALHHDPLIRIPEIKSSEA